MNITSKDGINSTNISWTSLSDAGLGDDRIDQKYLLNIVTNSTNQLHSFELWKSYFIFNGTDNAPACEVYNFSVTATYVGATYTGAGCSEPSLILSVTLPSLPDISRLQSSLYHSIEKQSPDGVKLNVSFRQVSCKQCNYHY